MLIYPPSFLVSSADSREKLIRRITGKAGRTSLAVILVLAALLRTADATPVMAQSSSVPPGYVLLETISVLTTSPAGVYSSNVLESGVDYVLVASGAYSFGGSGGGVGDAEYLHFHTAPVNEGVDKSAAASGVDLGIGINDPPADTDKSPWWGPYSPTHEYTLHFTGLGAPIYLNYHDDIYYDNFGSLTVKIFEPNVSEADLSITKTAHPDPVQVNGDLTYKITVNNSGPDDATAVTVTDNLPPNVDFVSATPSQGACVGNSPVGCTLGDLAAGSNATVDIVVKPTVAGTITNQAEVTASTSDPDTNNNSTSVDTLVGCAVPNVPLYKQWIQPLNGDPYWEDDPYGQVGTCPGRTMKISGCGTTAAAMLLTQRGVAVDPGQLNDWLRQQPDGYKRCEVQWPAVARYAREHGVNLWYKGYQSRSSTTDDLLN